MKFSAFKPIVPIKSFIRMQKFYIGPNLIRAYTENGLGQSDLSRLTNISQSQISRICSNKQAASIEQVEILARSLNITADDLIGANAMIFTVET